MDWKYFLLVESGFQIVTCSGAYCRACRDGRDLILRWDGERWLAL